jgi:xylan 1,4-beta-xylosidase
MNYIIIFFRKIISIILISFIWNLSPAQVSSKPQTFCNPLQLDYSPRKSQMAGEPVVVLHENDYYLFHSGAGGYFYSENMRDWTFVKPQNLEMGIASVIVIGDTFYYTSTYNPYLYATKDPKKGNWKQVAAFDRLYGDAAMFVDDDGRVYMYYGHSQLYGIMAVELDPKNKFKEIGKPVTCFFGNETVNGWEQRRHENLIYSGGSRIFLPEEAPWIEGPWMTKHNGKYYLQYACGGVQFTTYADGVYVSDNPLGPFKYDPHNPFSFKPSGFIPGSGHGCTFKAKDGNYWHMTMFISGMVGLYPVSFDAEGVMNCITEFGDYPQYYPDIKANPGSDNFTGWMLLSHKKQVNASSTLEKYGVENAVDEDVNTYWCAATGGPGENIILDLGKECEINALQVNFDQKDVSEEYSKSMTNQRYQSYTVHVSSDNKNWSLIIDKSNNTKDLPHDYSELSISVKARYVKLTNVFTPGGGKFAVEDLRVFGNHGSAIFTPVDNVIVARDEEDRRNATIMWEPVKGADGYIVRYGIEPGKLYNSYTVYDAKSLSIRSLYKKAEYYFIVEAFDSGTDYYRGRPTYETLGRGIQLELYRDSKMVESKMIYNGKNEYIYENIVPGNYYLNHSRGFVLWKGELTKNDVIGTGGKATITEVLFPVGKGEEVLGEVIISVIPGKESGKFLITFR